MHIFLYRNQKSFMKYSYSCSKYSWNSRWTTPKWPETAEWFSSASVIGSYTCGLSFLKTHQHGRKLFSCLLLVHHRSKNEWVKGQFQHVRSLMSMNVLNVYKFSMNYSLLRRCSHIDEISAKFCGQKRCIIHCQWCSNVWSHFQNKLLSIGWCSLTNLSLKIFWPPVLLNNFYNELKDVWCIFFFIAACFRV